MPDFSVTRMHTECLDDFDKDFMAKHEEGLGDVWSAVLSDDDDIVQYLEKIISKGTSRKEWSSSINGKRAVLIQYPERSPIRAGALLAKAEDGGDFELYSCYPVFKGIINNLKILKTHA